MQNSFRITRDAIVLEAFSATDLSGLIHNLIPQLVGQMKDFFGRFNPEDPAIVLTSQQQNFIKEVQKHTFLDLAPLAAHVPQGMNKTYLAYASELQAATEHTSKIIDEVLAPYSLFLSQLVSHPDQKLSTVSFDPLYKRLAMGREVINEDLGECFKKGSSQTQVTLGDVVQRNADWTAVFHLVDQLNREINSVDRKTLNKKMKECDELLEIIVKKIKREELKGITPEAIKNLAEGAYQVASELEFYSVTYYKTLALTESINRTIEHFESVFNKK